jgi:hypothetical protein
MKAKIAVATTSGKAYYLIVNELKKRNIPFLSLTPNEPIPMEIEAVITTENEQRLISHEKTLTYREGVELEALINEALQIAQGKEYYERIIIGLDPGEVLGLAVLADGKIIETRNCFSVEDAVVNIKNILKNLRETPISSVSIKIGNGAPEYNEKLLLALDNELPQHVVLESVNEDGTDRPLSRTKHRRGLRDIDSAIRIAGRNGQVFRRRMKNESNSRKRQDSTS